MPLFILFAFVLATLKLLGYIAISWLAVVLVGLIPLAIFLVILIVFFGAFGLAIRGVR